MKQITFLNGPDFAGALTILQRLSDSQLETKDKACTVLKRAGLDVPLRQIETMSQDEWDDFVVNNLDSEA